MNTTRLHPPAGPLHPTGTRLLERPLRSLPMARIVVVLALVSFVALLAACGGDGSDGAITDQPVTITSPGPNAVSTGTRSPRRR